MKCIDMNGNCQYWKEDNSLIKVCAKKRYGYVES